MEKTTLVLDASVLIKWYYEEEYSEKAIAIRDMFERSEIDIIVPQIIYYEVSNAIRYNKYIKLEDKDRIIENLFSLGLETRLLSCEDILRTNQMAIENDTSIYDTAYLEMARNFEITLVTADEAFAKKVRAKDVVLLREWKPKSKG